MFNANLLIASLVGLVALTSSRVNFADEIDTRGANAPSLDLADTQELHVLRVQMAVQNPTVMTVGQTDGLSNPQDSFTWGPFLQDLAEGVNADDLASLDRQLQPARFERTLNEKLVALPDDNSAEMLTGLDQSPKLFLELDSGERLVARFVVPGQMTQKPIATTASSTETAGRFLNQVVEFFQPANPLPSPIPEAASSFVVCSLVGIVCVLTRRRKIHRRSNAAAR